MDFKDILGKLDQLNEAEMASRKVAGKAYGGAAQHDDEDDEDGEKKPAAPAVKRGRGRPRKAGGEADTGAKYSGAKELQNWIVGNIPKDSKALKKLPKTKHSLKEHLDAMLDEAEQVTIMPAQQKTSVIKQGDKTLGSVTNPALANTIKQAIGKGEMSLAGDEELGEAGYSAKAARAGKDIGKPGKQFAKIAKSAGERYGSKERGEKVAGAVLAKLRKTNEADMPPNDALSSPLTFEAANKPVSNKIYTLLQAEHIGPNAARKFVSAIEYEYDIIAARMDPTFSNVLQIIVPNKEAKSLQKKLWELNDGAQVDMKQITPDDADVYMESVFAEAKGKKPDFLDIDKDGDKKESMKKAAADKKKKKVAEGMSQRLQAARLEGRAHGLKGHSHCGKNYEDMEEARCYHEGYKEGLDECYGMMPISGVVVGEETPAATVPGMASQSTTMPAMEDDMEEGNAFTGALAKAKHGEKFSVGGKTFTDTSDYDAKVDEMMMAFESWDKQLNALLTESEVVEEGMSISVSKGQQGAPDSVSVTASDSEADSLMALVKQMGIFGDEKPSGYGAPEGEMSHAHGDINVVDDHEGMMALMKRLSGQEQGSEDYADEEHDHDHGHDEDHGELEVCEVCGESECGCDDEMVDETETPDQMEFEVSEDNAPDSDEAETSADEDAEAQEDKDLAQADELNEWANEAGKIGTDEAFDTDIAFMTKVISGGLNKQKSTGQTTVPVIAHQDSRMGVDGMNESTDTLADWKKLSGIR